MSCDFIRRSLTGVRNKGVDDLLNPCGGLVRGNESTGGAWRGWRGFAAGEVDRQHPCPEGEFAFGERGVGAEAEVPSAVIAVMRHGEPCDGFGDAITLAARAAGRAPPAQGFQPRFGGVFIGEAIAKSIANGWNVIEGVPGQGQLARRTAERCRGRKTSFGVRVVGGHFGCAPCSWWSFHCTPDWALAQVVKMH